MNPTITPIQSASLYFREGTSDKEYHAAIEPKDDGYIVTFAYGRRGSTLTTGSKTEAPVSLAEAIKVFDKLVASKVAKGYRATGDSAIPYQQSGLEGRDTGIRCQLLNAIEESQVDRLIENRQYCAQEKYDGRRLMVRRESDKVTGINRRGLTVAIPEPIRIAMLALPCDSVLLDGEAVGEILHVFDLPESCGHDLRHCHYVDRYSSLVGMLGYDHPVLSLVKTAFDRTEKVEMLRSVREAGGEGVVFKDIDAPYVPGRPASGGTQLKYKFVESASFVVTARNAKRSVSLGLYNGDGDTLVPAGNVTIPPNHAVPVVGEVCEVQFLYAFKESGSIYQPVYLGKRCDIPATECTTDQLKYKSQSSGEAAA